MTSTNCATLVVPGPQGPRHPDTRLAAGQVLRVEVARIHAYERNPRHSPNPEYDRIKASILVHGMDQLLQITRRPAQQDFIVRAGGNTRLQIVKELFAATGEECFGVVECQYLEWQGETDVLLAHLRENDLRGNLTFIDKARAVIDAKGLLAEEHGVDDIAYRELEGILKGARLQRDPCVPVADELRGKHTAARHAQGTRGRPRQAPGTTHPQAGAGEPRHLARPWRR
ncbi:MAG: ParB family protein [Woeseiaceae bacterium]|nr:ParB family protein [Woeseiaceae bacterium]